MPTVCHLQDSQIEEYQHTRNHYEALVEQRAHKRSARCHFWTAPNYFLGIEF